MHNEQGSGPIPWCISDVDLVNVAGNILELLSEQGVDFWGQGIDHEDKGQGHP